MPQYKKDSSLTKDQEGALKGVENIVQAWEAQKTFLANEGVTCDPPAPAALYQGRITMPL